MLAVLAGICACVALVIRQEIVVKTNNNRVLTAFTELSGNFTELKGDVKELSGNFTELKGEHSKHFCGSDSPTLSVCQDRTGVRNEKNCRYNPVFASFRGICL